MQWTHPAKSEAQFRIDMAQCKNEALRNIQQQPVVLPPNISAPIASQQYDTNCSRIGNNLNCTTTSNSGASYLLAQQQAQIAQNQAQAYALFKSIFGAANVPHQPQQIA